MSSIFIWKTDAPLPLTTVSYYSGADWFLQEMDGVSLSYSLVNQYIFSSATHHTVLVYDGTVMPPNWVGSELLEVTDVPYQRIKEDNYGRLEQLGTWMRCIVHKSMGQPEDEFVNIMEWSRCVNKRVETHEKRNKVENTYHTRNVHHTKMQINMNA